jgi:DNA mismatch repair ATPase MutS
MKKHLLNYYKDYRRYTELIKQRTESETVVCLYQNGSFSEIYTDDEGFASRLANLVKLSYGVKNENIFMVGWPKTVDCKYIPILLEAQIAVGVVEQSDKLAGEGTSRRHLVEIITPQTNIATPINFPIHYTFQFLI